MITLREDPAFAALARRVGLDPRTPEQRRAEARAKQEQADRIARARREFHAWLLADYGCWVEEGRAIRRRYRWAASKQRQRVRAKQAEADRETLAALGY